LDGRDSRDNSGCRASSEDRGRIMLPQ
jgi:hypothetical protein